MSYILFRKDCFKIFRGRLNLERFERMCTLNISNIVTHFYITVWQCFHSFTVLFSVYLIIFHGIIIFKIYLRRYIRDADITLLLENEAPCQVRVGTELAHRLGAMADSYYEYLLKLWVRPSFCFLFCSVACFPACRSVRMYILGE